MNKTDFIKELSRLLGMLQEDEVSDILEEYEHHINMKLSEGKTEEEATADFGNIEELAAEILSAYHVKAGFTEKKKEKKTVLPDKNYLKSFFKKKTLFQKKKTEKPAEKKPKKETGKGFLRVVKAVWSWISCVFFGTLFSIFGILEIGLLFAAGILIVLLVMGYPVIGISLMIVGTAMSLFSVTYVCGIKMRRRTR